MIILRVLFIVICGSLLLVESDDFFLDTYKSAECTNKKLCILKILEFLHSETNYEFKNSERAKQVKNMVGEYQLDALNIYSNKMLVYSVFDPFYAKHIINSLKSMDREFSSDIDKFKSVYNLENYKRLEQLFVYIGSGIYSRPHKHVFYSKAMCPNKNQAFVHRDVSPLVLYICSTLFDKLNDNFDIFVYPIIGLKDYKQALKLETALTYTLSDVVVNYKLSTETDIDEYHFLAHFAMEATFRFMKDEYDNIRYDHRITPEFPLHENQQFGIYENEESPKKLIYQGNVFFQYESRDFKYNDDLLITKVTPYVRLPFGILDYDLPNEKTQLIVRNELDKLMEKFFKISNPDVTACYNKHKGEIKENMKKTLKNYIGELYYFCYVCITLPIGISDFQIKINNDLLRRVRAKFEYNLLFPLYVDNEKNKNLLNVDWFENNKKNHTSKCSIC